MCPLIISDSLFENINFCFNQYLLFFFFMCGAHPAKLGCTSKVHRRRKGGGGGGGGGGKCPPTFLELYINCRMVAPNCCARPVA